QGFLDSLDIPYTGSGVMASAVAMDKIISKYIYIQSGLTVPPYSIFGQNHPQNTVNELSRKHGFPCFVKCPQSGSSRLMGKADSSDQLEELLAELQPHASEILVESAIKGIEFSCGVLENADGTITSLPPIEIRPRSTFFDYTAKYTDGASEEIVPAPYPEELLKRIGDIAIKSHQVLGCSGFSRTDMIYCNNELYVLETNTLPGLTRNSLLPKAYKAAGGTYTSLLDTFIESALHKKIYSSII
ncbi:MAG: D-alanine--D-alanine ligase, partial [Fibrobacter sp.]|nr:D-alanine--D-alanine ligase [Fibrobacter sp.]